MNKHAAMFLLLPVLAWGNELPPPKAEAKPTKTAESHAAPVPEVKTVSKHAAPQQMTEPIKILKPVAEHAAPAPQEHAAAPEVKPVNPSVSRYVSPQFSSTNVAVHRPVVRSQAPIHSATRSRSSSATSYAVKPGLVRVLPASQIPSFAILPPAKSTPKSVAVLPNVKSNVTWGAIEAEAPKTVEVSVPVVGRKIASPKFYNETNSEQRWQYYSYP